jgi:hypothetical protein
MRSIHIVGGTLALIAGFVALFLAKGSPGHRRAGWVFVLAMGVMTLSALIIAVFVRPNTVNVIAATMTFYLVVTAYLAVRARDASMPGVLAGLAVVAATVAMAAVVLAIQGKTTLTDSVPPPPLYLFASIALAGAIGDARVLYGRVLSRPQITLRHLWRMTTALWIATMSFFLGQAKFVPEPLRQWPILLTPVLTVLALMAYWIWRVHRSNRGQSTVSENRTLTPISYSN